MKYDGGKPRVDLIPPGVILELAKIYAMGAEKYSEHGWLEDGGMDWSRIYAALQRHALAFWGGEDIDPESGLPHMAHVMWNAAALVHYGKTGLGQDDRLRAGAPEIKEDIPF